MRRFVSTTLRASSCTRAPSAQFFLPRTTPFFVRFFALRCSRETRRGKHDSGRDVMELICEIGIYEGKKAKRRGTGRCCLKRNALRFDYQDSLLFFFFLNIFLREKLEIFPSAFEERLERTIRDLWQMVISTTKARRYCR